MFQGSSKSDPVPARFVPKQLPSPSPWTPELSQEVDSQEELSYWKTQWKKVEVDPSQAKILLPEFQSLSPKLQDQVYPSLFQVFSQTSDRRWTPLLRAFPERLRAEILARVGSDPELAVRWMERFLARPRSLAKEHFQSPEVRQAVLALAERPEDPEQALLRGPSRRKALGWLLKFKIREGIPRLVEAAGIGKTVLGQPRSKDPFGPVADFATQQMELFRARRSRQKRKRSQAKRRR